MKINPDLLAEGGLDMARESPENVARLQTFITDNFAPVDLSAFPGTRVLNIDPPVLSIDSFLPDEVCDALVAGAMASAKLQPSSVGAYTGPGPADNVRTSSTLPLTKEVLAPGGDLTRAVSEVLQRAMRLVPLGLPTDPAAPAMFQRPSGPAQWVFEQPQVTRYEPGQHFLAHEDAFPPPIARGKGYQRHATLLLYLNNVPQGGATHFDVLDISSQPSRGKALLFFPSFAPGINDPRSVHTAQDAVDPKWVSQVWLSRGLLPPQQGQQLEAQQQEQPDDSSMLDGRAARTAKKKQRKKASGGAKGFGAR